MVAPVRVPARAAGRRMRSRPALATLAVLMLTVLSAAGCVSVQTGGPVRSFPVTQGTEAQSNPYVQIEPQIPGNDWSPSKIVQGFLTASASFGTYDQVALQYLTPHEQKVWSQLPGSAVIYKTGPNVADATYPPAAKSAASAPGAKSTPSAKSTSSAKSTPSASTATTATVQVTGTIQATLKGSTYSAAPTSSTGSSPDTPAPFVLVKGADGQWRISSAPLELLLTGDSFSNDYQLRNLYFFDPSASYLVPDPIYVPLRAPGYLMNGLVQDLIIPPDDWLSGGATKTAIPAGTKIVNVTVLGVIAVVNLTGSIAKASDAVLEQVSSQLLWTLSGAGQGGLTGQGVPSIEVEPNGKQWTPPGSEDNPVQRVSTKKPAYGTYSMYYYVDSDGYLTSRQGTTGKAMRMEHIGTKYSQVAVSPDGRYLAALNGTTLYTGLVNGSLDKQGTGYQAMSWDRTDDLWTSQGGQVIMYRETVTLRQPFGQLTAVPVDVYTSDRIKNPGLPFSQLRVAPDGVRVALVIGDNELTFAAISGEQGSDPRITLSPVQLSPLGAGATEFTGLTWYGPDNVITLGQGPAATEYPVSGSTPTPIPVEPGMETITASSGNLLIAGLTNGTLVADSSLTGAWMPLGNGTAPAYPG